MSRTSLVQKEWPVEFRCDFNIITRGLSRASLLFDLWSLNLREPSNWSIKSQVNQVARFWEFKTGFQTGSTEVHDALPHFIPSLSAIWLIWKYQQANDNNAAVIAMKTRVNLFSYASWSARWERRQLIATKKKREGEEERYWTNFF